MHTGPGDTSYYVKEIFMEKEEQPSGQIRDFED